MLYKNPYKDIPKNLRVATYVFCDLENYTHFVSKHKPKEVLEYLDLYYNWIFTLAQKHQGRAIDVLGDGVGSIFWGKDHATHAFNFGMKILEEYPQHHFPFQLKIGISTGKVGGELLMKSNIIVYTLVGQGIIEACREETLSKKLHSRLIINEHTWQLLKPEDQGKLQRVSQEYLKGLTEKFALYSLVK